MTENFSSTSIIKLLTGNSEVNVLPTGCTVLWTNVFQKKEKRTRAIDSKVGMNEVEASRLHTINECGWVEYPLIMIMMRTQGDSSTGAHKHKYFKT